MSLDNILKRYCDSEDFINSYKNLCTLQDSIPIILKKSNLNNDRLELNSDKIRLFNWPPLLNAIKFDRSLIQISIFSLHKHFLKKKRRPQFFKINTPPIVTNDITRRLAISLKSCLQDSPKLQKLELQGIPFSQKDIITISRGLVKNKSLTHLSIDYCSISKVALKALCESLKQHPSLTSISLDGCNLSCITSAVHLLRHQSLQHHTERWAESLRYRDPDPISSKGIRRISLNDNPAIGDDAALQLSEILQQDLWIKAIDLQRCGLSNNGANLLLKSLESNHSLVVLDIRNNPAVSEMNVRRVLASVLLNSKPADEDLFPWIKHQYPKIEYCSSRRRRSSIVLPSNRFNQNSNVATKNKNNQIKSEEKKKSKIWMSSKDDRILFLEQEVEEFKKKLKFAEDMQKSLKEMVIHLESENSNLKTELKEKEENLSLKLKIDNSNLLENVEQSFNKFHEFLDRLHDVGIDSAMLQSSIGTGNLASISPIPDNGGDGIEKKFNDERNISNLNKLIEINEKDQSENNKDDNSEEDQDFSKRSSC